MIFEDNCSRVGVRFDDSIPGGNNLNAPTLCEESHGFFVETSDLVLLDKNFDKDTDDQLAIKSLFRVCSTLNEEKMKNRKVDVSIDTLMEIVENDSKVDRGGGGAASGGGGASTDEISLPCIICIRDVNAVMSCNYERFDFFKEALDALKAQKNCPVVILGISTRFESSSKHSLGYFQCLYNISLLTLLT